MAVNSDGGTASGAFYLTVGTCENAFRYGSNPMPRDLNFDASRSNVIYGSSQTVQPPAIVLIPQIKL